MTPRVSASLSWGAVGGMAFLALVQGYHLLGGAFVGITPMAVGAVVVLAVTTVLTHVLRPRLTGNESP